MLTATQKAQLRLYLGYPDHFRYKHTRLESVLDNLSAEAEVIVADALAKLAVVEVGVANGAEAASTAISTTASGIKRVDDVWFFGPSDASSGSSGGVAFKSLKAAGRFYINRLSIITGVPIYSDVFGSQGYLGDSFSGLGGRPNGGFYRLG